MDFWNKHKWLLAVLVLGTLIRLAWVYEVDTQPIYDFKHYHDLAMSLLHHGTYTMPEGLDYIKTSTDYIKAGEPHPTAFRPPGYPFFLVVLYAIHPSILTAKLANVALSAIWMLCIYALGSHYFNRRIGLCAAWVTALFPPAVYYTSVIGTEILSVTLLLVILCVQTFKLGGKIGTHVISGLLIGYLCLVKPYFIVYPLLYAVILWWLRRDRLQEGVGHHVGPLPPLPSREFADSVKRNPMDKSANEELTGLDPKTGTGRSDHSNDRGRLAVWWKELRRFLPGAALATAGLIVMMAAIILPWTVRNYAAFDRFVLISTNGSTVLYQNSNDASNGTTMDVMKVPNSIFKTDRILDANGVYNEAVAMETAKQEAKNWIMTHKKEFFVLGLKRLAASYFTIGIEIWGWTMSTAQLHFDKFWIDPLTLGARAGAFVVVGGGLVYALAVLVQFVRMRRISAMHKVNLMFIMFFSAIIFVTEGQPRYMFPAFPFFILGVSWMADKLTRALREERG